MNTMTRTPIPPLRLGADTTRLDIGVTAALVLLCLPYVLSGVAKLFGFSGAVAEFTAIGLPLPAVAVAATIALQLGASALVITQRLAWAGALALAVFTIVATLIAHPFWRFEGNARFAQTNIFFEHVGLVGAFLLVALLDWRRRYAA